MGEEGHNEVVKSKWTPVECPKCAKIRGNLQEQVGRSVAGREADFFLCLRNSGLQTAWPTKMHIYSMLLDIHTHQILGSYKNKLHAHMHKQDHTLSALFVTKYQTSGWTGRMWRKGSMYAATITRVCVKSHSVHLVHHDISHIYTMRVLSVQAKMLRLVSFCPDGSPMQQFILLHMTDWRLLYGKSKKVHCIGAMLPPALGDSDAWKCFVHFPTVSQSTSHSAFPFILFGAWQKKCVSRNTVLPLPYKPQTGVKIKLESIASLGNFSIKWQHVYAEAPPMLKQHISSNTVFSREGNLCMPLYPFAPMRYTHSPDVRSNHVSF